MKDWVLRVHASACGLGGWRGHVAVHCN
jgi:hypothetical protein